MSDLSERLATLTPEKRLLLELLRKAKQDGPPHAGRETAEGDHPTRTRLAGSTMPDEAVKTAPFDLVSGEDRRRLPADVEDAYPLTVMQLGMLTHMELRADSPTPPAYHNVNSFHLRAPFHLPQLQEAVDRVVAHHPVLRTSFDLTNYSEPLQLVHKEAHLPVQVVDLRHLSPDERANALRAFIEEENFRLFDLSRSPLLRYFIHRLTDETFQFTLVEPHSISDGWSTNLTLAEVGETYHALLKGEPPPALPDEPVTFRDFVHLERLTLENEECRRFWQAKLDEWTSTKLPRWPAAFHARATIEDHKVAYMIPREVTEGLYRLARQARVPLKSVFFAAHLKVMAFVCSQPDVVTGLVFNSRPEVAGGDRVHGMYLNTLPLPFRLRPGTWVELVKQAYESEVEMMPYRRYPLAELQRNWGSQQLYESAFTFLHFHSVEGVLRSGTFEDLGYGGSDLSVTNFLLMVLFTMSTLAPNRVALQLQFDVNEFSKEQMRQLLGYYDRVMTAMAADPSARHDRQTFLPARERQQLLGEWNDTAQDFPSGTSFQSLFEQQAARTPDAVAVACSGARLTYRELDERAERLARALSARGVGPEVVVALLAERGLDFLTAMLGVWKAGGAYLPLDPQHPAQRLGLVLSQSRVRHLLAGAEFAEAAREAEAASGEHVEVFVLEELLAEEPLAEKVRESVSPTSTFSPRQLAYVIYTSGSTGVPKGVMVEHGGMLNHLLAKISDLELGAADVVAQTASQAFDISVWQFLAALLVGGRVEVFVEEEAHDPARLLDGVEQQGVTVLETVPSLLRAMLDEMERRAPEGARLSRLRWLIPTGEALPPELTRRWLAAHPTVPLVNAYGPTECSDDVTHHVIREQPVEAAVHTPIGRPVANTRLYVLDAGMQLLPVGVLGELYVGGAGVGRGYLSDAAKTASLFVPDPYSGEAGARLYRTGDVGRWLPDGTLEFLGRVDHQVKVRGFRIELGEIEAALFNHPRVREAVVLAREDEVGDARLVAYLVAAEDSQPDASELRSFLRQRLPDYMVPSAFVLLEEMPLTENGKVDRRALPAPEAQETSEAYVAPRTPMEEMLASIWAEVLKVERVGVEDNFFDLGGHSLLAFQLVTRVRQTFRVEVLLRNLFAAPTVAGLAAFIESEARGAGQLPPLAPIARASRAAGLPLSFAQQRLWFLDQLQPGSAAYNIPVAIRLEGALDHSALRRSLAEVVRRHETLRTIFDGAEGEPRQVVVESSTIVPAIVDLRGVPDAARTQEVDRLIIEEARRPFDLTRGPLLRLTLLHTDEDEHVALLTMHHIISDGWSMDVFVRELAALYEAHRTGAPSTLAPLPIQYADYAVWQREWLRGATLDAQLAFWKEQLRGAPGQLELPTSRPRPAVQTYTGATTSFTLPADVSARLRELSRREGATLFMTLLAAFDVFLARYTGQADIVVGSPVAGRNRTEVEGLIGFFVNTLVLRADLSGDPTFRELLARVRETALGAYAHQDVPFEKLVEELQPVRDLSRSPLFQVMFVLQNRAVETLELPGLKLTTLSSERGAAKFDLTVTLEETTDELEGSFEYNSDLFDEQTIRRMIGHFSTLLAAVAAAPHSSISTLPLFGDAERKQIVSHWNDTARGYARTPLLPALISQQAHRTPDALALTFDGHSLTYGELEARANRLAHHLQRLGVCPDTLVGLLMERSIELLVALLAVWKAGAAYVPLDPDYPVQRLAYMLADSRADVLLTQPHLHERLSSMSISARHIVTLGGTGGAGDEAQWADESTEPPEVALDPQHLAYVIYTSGSTGEPKGAANSHAAILNRLLWMQE
ncbi:MAG: amino acid adenylation domain-containing protein, partial [Pyrinomonadaceae bacterium]